MYRPNEGPAPDPWDPVIRVTHWVIAGVVVGNALLTKGGGSLHVWLGWLGMSCLALRLVWGFTGPAAARFAAFPPRPIAALSHVNRVLRGRKREYRSHNPAGAMMIYALWLTLAGVIGSGLYLSGGATPWEVARQEAAVAAGNWSAVATEAGEGADADQNATRKLIGEIHELGGNLLLVLAVIHLAGVAVESIALRRNLVRPMLFRARR